MLAIVSNIDQVSGSSYDTFGMVYQCGLLSSQSLTFSPWSSVHSSIVSGNLKSSAMSVIPKSQIQNVQYYLAASANTRGLDGISIDTMDIHSLYGINSTGVVLHHAYKDGSTRRIPLNTFGETPLSDFAMNNPFTITNLSYCRTLVYFYYNSTVLHSS